ncbi:MAG: hypothetical protein ACI8PZ_004906 [Myxococcota bacterium]
MVVFNLHTVLVVLVGALIGGCVGGLSALVGGEFDVWFVFVTFQVAAVLDGLMRLANLGGSETAGASTLVAPSGGAHLFFVPLWLSGTVMAVAVAIVGWLI